MSCMSVLTGHRYSASNKRLRGRALDLFVRNSASERNELRHEVETSYTAPMSVSARPHSMCPANGLTSTADASSILSFQREVRSAVTPTFAAVEVPLISTGGGTAVIMRLYRDRGTNFCSMRKRMIRFVERESQCCWRIRLRCARLHRHDFDWLSRDTLMSKDGNQYERHRATCSDNAYISS
jgi:hypothetical protein